MVVVDHDGEPAIPIFERTADMKRHAGQMALPGGRVHDGESVEACALRELHDSLQHASSDDEVECCQLSNAFQPYVRHFYAGYFDPERICPTTRPSSRA